MNRENLRRLADALEEGLPGVRFDMSSWRTDEDCGTVACIGGHAELLFGVEGERAVAERLSLPTDLAFALFYPPSVDLDAVLDPWEITGPEAARVVRHLAETGELDWRRARP